MNLRQIEMELIDDVFLMHSGYVLDFTNRTFSEFFLNEVGVNIDDDVYCFNGPSKAKRLRAFLQIGQRRAVAKALQALWEYRETKRRRSKTVEDLPHARGELSTIIQKLGGQPLPDYQSSADVGGASLSDSDFSTLQDELGRIMDLAPHPRGYAFEGFLRRLFDLDGLKAREAFRVVGEQIDGSFELANEIYLLEAKWQNTPTDAASLRAFHGKVEDRPTWTRGLFVSYTGFSEDGLIAFKGKRIVLMDGLDLYDSLQKKISISQVIRLKLRRASETGRVFVRVRDLFSEK